MFLDASAITAILTLEDGHQHLAPRIGAAAGLITSAIAIYEAALALARRKRIPVSTATEELETFLERIGAGVSPIDFETSRLALDAFARYGKGRGHPAQLNMGDCFAYAMAKQHGVPLLYKGDDFVHTDLA